jgi:hypothetical protein
VRLRSASVELKPRLLLRSQIGAATSVVLEENAEMGDDRRF